MIKEFWQERKEEKRKQKELKKQNKKLPKNREQRAYKIFGVLFALFLIFGSIFYTCRGAGDFDNYSWDSLIGITDDMKAKLSADVDKSKLITNKELSVVDWSGCRDLILSAGLDVISNDKIDTEKLDSKNNVLNSPLYLQDNFVGSIASQLIESSVNKDDIDLIELIIFQDGNIPMLKTLMRVNLSAMVFSSTLPKVYLTTTSRLEILNNKLFCLDTTFKINDFSEEDNTEIIKVLEKSSILGLEYFTSDLVVNQVNYFADGINATVDIVGLRLKILPKNV